MLRTTSPSEPAKREATDITLDVNALLHEHATSIKGLSAPIRAVLDCMSTEPFEAHGEPRRAELLGALRTRLADLRSRLRSACTGTGSPPDNAITLLADRVQALAGETNGTALSHRAQACAREVLAGVAAKDSRLHAIATEIIRVSTVAELLKAESQIVEIAEQTRALRDVFVAAVASPEIARAVDFLLLVQRAVNNARPYAESRRIDFRLSRRLHRPKPLFVKVEQSDVQRALSNLLSNAIKYSYTMVGNFRAWVDVDVYRSGAHAYAEFRNWGVPIVQEDFGSNRLFTPRYRGRYALEQGRAGTGMGLWDAKKTARRHGGDVTIESVPARAGETPDAPTWAYITTAKLAIACTL